MTTCRAAVLADDATGALEAGALLAAPGCPAEVRFDLDINAETIPVIDTETRHRPAAEAFDIVRQAACRLAAAGVQSVYKKTDSTLRGHIGAELSALMDVFAGIPLIYVPAYPANGRTVRGGELFVEGKPVSLTAFGTDPLNPVRHSRIEKTLRPDYSGPVTSIRHARELRSIKPGITICDSESEQNLTEIADALRSLTACCLFAGPAAFVRYWAGLIDLPKGTPPRVHTARRLLLVCGSLHPVSRAQVEHARAQGEETIVSPLTPEDPAAAAQNLASAAARQIERSRPDALVIFGGDTVRALCRELGWNALHPLGELDPGISVSTPRGAEIMVIAKAGGFGPVDVVNRIRERLAK